MQYFIKFVAENINQPAHFGGRNTGDNMRDELSDIQIGFRELASDIEHRFECLERDKANDFTVESLTEKVFELENIIFDLKEELQKTKEVA